MFDNIDNKDNIINAKYYFDRFTFYSENIVEKRTYDADAKVFELVNRVKWLDCSISSNAFGNRILFCNNAILTIEGRQYSMYRDYDWLQVPRLTYLVGKGFRIYLNDFHNDTYLDSNDQCTVNRFISRLELTINNSIGECLVNGVNVLQYRDVEKDSSGRYYVDCLFGDFMPFINTITEDYKIGLDVVLRSNRQFSGDPYILTTDFDDISVWRYQYNANNGAGVLVDFNEGVDPTPSPSPTPTLEPTPDKTEEAIKEQTEVSKNIFQQIIELPGKIIQGFLDMLKSLFIPSDDFFTNWLDDLNQYFSDAFGILYYPVDLLIDFLNRVSALNDTGTAIINIPEFKLSFMGHEAVVLHAYSYDLNSILTNDTFKNIHTIYLTIVDLILWLGVVYLASNCMHMILGGVADTSIPDYDTTEEYKETQTYKNTARQQRANLNHQQNMRRNRK